MKIYYSLIFFVFATCPILSSDHFDNPSSVFKAPYPKKKQNNRNRMRLFTNRQKGKYVLNNKENNNRKRLLTNQQKNEQKSSKNFIGSSQNLTTTNNKQQPLYVNYSNKSLNEPNDKGEDNFENTYEKSQIFNQVKKTHDNFISFLISSTISNSNFEHTNESNDKKENFFKNNRNF